MEEKEVTLKELFQNIKEYLGVIPRKKWWIIGVSLVFGAFGLYSNKTAKIEYTADLSYLIAEDESGSGGGVSSVLGQFGFPGGGGSYNYDKIIELAKSTKIVEKVILDSVSIDGETNTIGNHIINQYNIKLNDSLYYFKHATLSELDSVERVLFKKVYYMMVDDDKTKQPLLSTVFNENDKILRSTCKTLSDDLSIGIVQNHYKHLSEFYNVLSTGKQAETFLKLQNRVDSLQRAIRGAEYGAASQLDKQGLIENTERVPAAQQQRKVEILYAMYGEALKSLETARFLNHQNGDFFLTVDLPFKPLQDNKQSLPKAVIVAFFSGLVLATIFLWMQKFYIDNLK